MFRDRRLRDRGGSSAHYREGPPRSGIPDYRQLDGYSCGFIAALTVIHRFWFGTSPMDVLRYMRPGFGGCDSDLMIDSLAHFGVSAQYVNRLGARRLARLLEEEKALIVTVWPWGWGSDHWTVVRKVMDGKVFLTNYGSHIRGMTWESFSEVWCPKGGAIVCERGRG